jgi:quinol-cytochrome oxidoreductase complex cytochrome b subunit
LGGISVFLILILTITGVLEVFYYIPSVSEANRSLQQMTYLVPYGRLIRSLHFWSAQLLLGATLLHLLRVVLTGSYKTPRRFNWLIGMILLLVILFFDFTGYGLRWDQDISWAILVGTNLLKSVPGLGPTLYKLVVGGSQLGGQTVVRFYVWHIYVLTLVGIIFVVWHIFRVRRDGGISRAKREDLAQPKPNITRQQLLEKEIVAAYFVSILLLALAVLYPPSLSGPADFTNIPQEAGAPWFFVWIQQLLRLGNPLVMGVAVPLGMVILLAVVPYFLDRNAEGVGLWFNRPGRLMQGITLVIYLVLITLTILGSVR